ncbi:MAG: hypothetical protein JWR24_4843 [Actinoallomurus sp.]|nr:hypothetical protein [Actinoallomurus sp.]
MLDDLIAFTRDLGRADRDLVIPAEGNTSIRTGTGRMLSAAMAATSVAALDSRPDERLCHAEPAR